MSLHLKATISFLGFPTHNFGPDKQVKTFLQTHVKDRTIALFITHMAPEDAPPLQGWIQKFRDAAVGANIVGVFNCQGQASRRIKTLMLIPLFFMRQSDTSQGQPDAARLERARIFANEIINRLEP